jgi:hypothetical protein
MWIEVPVLLYRELRGGHHAEPRFGIHTSGRRAPAHLDRSFYRVMPNLAVGQYIYCSLIRFICQGNQVSRVASVA